MPIKTDCPILNKILMFAKYVDESKYSFRHIIIEDLKEKLKPSKKKYRLEFDEESLKGDTGIIFLSLVEKL